MKTNNTNKIEDFGQKIGGARKDYAQQAKEYAERLANVTPEDLRKLTLSKCATLPNLQKLSEAGAISAENACAVLAVWRSIETKPKYGLSRWIDNTKAKLNLCASLMRGEMIGEEIRKSADFVVLIAAGFPASGFVFGSFKVGFSRSWGMFSGAGELRAISGGYYVGPKNDAKAIADFITEQNAQKQANKTNCPELEIYKNRVGEYFITPKGKSEIVLFKSMDRAEAVAQYQNNREELGAKYAALRSFPELRRDWNRPRVGQDWRKGENVSPDAFAAALAFRGVEFGNWLTQAERASLLNAAFDGFHDLAQVLGITAEDITLRQTLAFAFASRGVSHAAAHYEPMRQVINLTKKNGAGCMAHEWWHAVDNFAAGGGVHNYATESGRSAENAVLRAGAAILEAIYKTDYYKRSKKMASFKGNYWTESRELTARAFEGVCAFLLDRAGICSDFLVNCKDMDEFTAQDVAKRADYYPYPTASEAAELAPLYLDFIRLVFGHAAELSAEDSEAIEAAKAKAEAEKAEAEAIRKAKEEKRAQEAAERAKREAEEAAKAKAESERKAQEAAERAKREAEAKAKQEAKKKTEAEKEVLRVVDYSEKAFALIGTDRTMSAQLKALGGCYNSRLSCGAGWIFSKKRLQQVREAFGIAC